MTSCADRARDRTVRVASSPALWPAWPFLPVVRRTTGVEELGVLFDARHVCGLTGFSAAVFRCLCRALHKHRYADWLIGQSLLDVLSRSIGFSGRSLGPLVLWTLHNQQCSRGPSTCWRAR
jgi:hypothetical protein